MDSVVAAFWAGLHLRTVLLGAVVFLLFANFLRRKHPKNYPPGPRGLPFLGNFFQLDFEQSHIAIQRYVKKYGNLLGMDFGPLSSVTISGLPLIKEAFITQDKNFMDRPVMPLRSRFFKTNGLLMSNGQSWKEQRRFTLTTLRNFGLGKKTLEERIQEEAFFLNQELEKEKAQPFDPHFKINNAVSNIICSVTFGERFEYQDNQFRELLWLLDEVVCLETNIWCQFYNTIPWIMDYLPGPHQKLFKYWGKLKLFVAHVIENHKKDWDPDKPRDFIDAYLKEIEKHKDDATSSFNEENLIFCTLDLFFAGTETTSTTLRWALLYMALNPDIQTAADRPGKKDLWVWALGRQEKLRQANDHRHEFKKVHAEIDSVLGEFQKPGMASRESLPYTNAVVHEVQRMGDIVPLNVPRAVSADTTLAGYHLPKGTLILTNLTALHKDPKVWATPDKFNPEHFLENGQFKKNESFLPFSLGKRVCLGEQLARTELFIFFTSLMQKFTFRPPDNEQLSLKFRMGLTISPVTYRICAVPRS